MLIKLSVPLQCNHFSSEGSLRGDAKSMSLVSGGGGGGSKFFLQYYSFKMKIKGYFSGVFKFITIL